MLKNIAVALTDRVSVFELGVVCEVFGIDRTDVGVPAFDFAVCATGGTPVRTGSGFTIDTPYRIDRLAEADLICVPAWNDIDEVPSPELVDALRAAVDRGARVMSVCSGAFVLAAAGLLDGRCATTHWKYTRQLSERYPLIDVDPNVLYVDAGAVLTSAGTAAGIDLCLYMVREEFGSAVANTIARRMVIPPHREGGQAQYIETPIVEHDRGDDLSRVLAWAQAHLDQPLQVEDLARRAHMSNRTFARRFTDVTGTTPHRWLSLQRLLRAQHLLEESDHDVEEVARQAGFGSATTLRQHFGRWRGTSPVSYRRSFRAGTAA
ncbi:MAG: hypothetical protein QOK05_2846 [Chloroflexota bacterium]|jgi:transcriptional regulator GlxA family with amidase domain|nr:hypothetical protein [Chloroflexota bacterium]